jgi:hypothetical protein
MKSKKKRIIILVVVALAVLLLPVKSSQLKDGGTFQYHAIVYTIVIRHSLFETDGEKGYIEGTEIYIFGVNVFDNTSFVPENR